jgi:hypothetical protein
MRLRRVTGTLEPCVGNIAPISRLGFGGLCLQDGPLAVRQAVYASVAEYQGLGSSLFGTRWTHSIHLRGRPRSRGV